MNDIEIQNLSQPERVPTYQRCFNCKNGGKTVNVRCSNTRKSEMLTDMRTEFQWDNIDWKTVYESVNRLQTRITKAVKQKKWQLVKRLQYLLIHSHYAKLWAVRRVCQNIVRHTSLKLNMNPYLDRGYFEARRNRLRIRRISSQGDAIGL